MKTRFLSCLLLLKIWCDGRTSRQTDGRTAPFTAVCSQLNIYHTWMYILFPRKLVLNLLCISIYFLFAVLQNGLRYNREFHIASRYFSMVEAEVNNKHIKTWTTWHISPMTFYVQFIERTFSCFNSNFTNFHGSIGRLSSLVQVMACHRIDNEPIPESVMTLMYCVVYDLASLGHNELNYMYSLNT